MNDREILDWLEAYINEHGALLLHTGDVDTRGFPGLGLRPGFLRRTLREAVMSAAGRAAVHDALKTLDDKEAL